MKLRDTVADLADSLELPEEAVSDAMRVTLIGRRRAVVEHHRGLLGYDAQSVEVSAAAGRVRILGAELTAKLNHPFFTMLRNVSLFHAVERFGALVIGLWVLPDFVLVSMLLTLAVNCLRAAGTHDGRLFAQKNPPALVLLCAAAAGAGALFLAQNAFETDALQTNIVPIVNIVLLGIGTVGMYLVGRARGKI